MRFIYNLMIVCLSIRVFGGNDNTEISLRVDDAMQFFDAMKGVDKVEWSEREFNGKMVAVRHDTKLYQTMDGLVAIKCSAEYYMGIMRGHACAINFNHISRTKSENNIEKPMPRFFKAVLMNKSDSETLFERILKPYPSLQTFEKISLARPDGKVVETFKAYITCDYATRTPFGQPRSCSIAAVASE